jgi:exodeoxyribonuclease V gamma subunit
MLIVHQAHRIPRLVEELARRMEQDPLGPLEEELIVVESRGLARRLPLELTRRLGVTARLGLPSPSAFIWDWLLRPFAGDGLDRHSPWDKEALAWRITGLLVREPALAGPGAPLVTGADGPRAARELGLRLADLFDQYLVFRPGLLLVWQGDDHADLPGALQATRAATLAPWQKSLWLRLREACATPTRADLMARWLLRATPAEVRALPRRITFFNLRGLPPAQLKLLARLAEWRDLHFMLANPAPDFYWSDLATMRRRTDPLDASQAPLMQANGLELGQWIDQLLGENAQFGSPLDPPPPESGATCLQRLQRSLAELDAVPPGPLDASLQFHACHNTQRQAEVLHDRVLDLLDRDPELAPGDVLVLCADLESSRPALETVFGTQEEGRRIPWAISRSAEGPLPIALEQVLDLIDGRRQAEAVLAPLACGALRRRLGMETDDLPRLAEWLRGAGISWGRDAAHRAELGLPATDEHGWRAGLDRLVLGHAMESGGEDGDFLPCDAAAGHHELLLGLLSWLATLERLRGEVREDRDPARWLQWLTGQLPHLLCAREEHERRELEALRHRLREHALAVEAAGPGIALPWSVARDALREALQPDEGSVGGLDGRLTIAPMLAGRGLPARVVVLFGLDDQVFPRPARRDELDLCLRLPLPADRQPRDQDRGQFLDAVCAAGDALLLFWQGMDARDGSSRPPSVVTGELLGLLERSQRRVLNEAGIRDDQAVQDRLTEVRPRRHPLQGFSAHAFSAGSAGSFHQERHAMARALLRSRAGIPDAVEKGHGFWNATPLDLPPLDGELELEALLAFYKNPAKSFLKRAGLRLPWDGGSPARHEPFVLDPLDRGTLRRRLLQARLRRLPVSGEEARLRAEGLLPWGRPGRRQLEQLQALADDALRVARETANADPREVEIRCQVDGVALRGRLWHCDGALLLVDLSGAASNQLLPAWIQHLLWQLAEGDLPPVAQRRTLRVTLKKDQPSGGFLPTGEDAGEQAVTVLRRWREGQRAWLPWLGPVSEKLAGKSAGWEGTDEELLASNDWFEGLDHIRDDAWLRLALGGADPFSHPLLSIRVLDLARELGALWPARDRGHKEEEA